MSISTNALGISLTSTSSGGSLTAPVYIGTAGFPDTGVLEQATGSINGYEQIIVQNTFAGTSSSADIIVSNNLGTATTYYGDFGINSSTYTGSGSFNLPNATYLFAQNGDLAIGTTSSNAVHIVVNNGATDAATIATTGVMTYQPGVATPAGGSAAASLLFGTTSGFGIYYGSGVPTVSAAQGSLYLRSDGSSTSTRLYVNSSSGSGTTWTNVTTAG